MMMIYHSNKELNGVLETISEIIENYEAGCYLTPELLKEAQRKLSANIYYLTEINVQEFDNWNNFVYNFQGSNAAGQVAANKKFPYVRMTRKLIDAAKNVAIAMSNELRTET